MTLVAHDELTGKLLCVARGYDELARALGVTRKTAMAYCSPVHEERVIRKGRGTVVDRFEDKKLNECWED